MASAYREFFPRTFRSGIAWLGDFAIEHWPSITIVGISSVMTYLASVAEALAPYGWLAWGVVGIATAFVITLVFVMAAWAKKIRVRAKYDSLLLDQGSLVNPMDGVFERKRILLSAFALPSHPYIENKTFINCDFIGPANIYFLAGNAAQEIRAPRFDAVWLAPTAQFFNGYTFKNCVFRNCSFQRITMFASLENYEAWRNLPFVNWIGIHPSPAHLEERRRVLHGEPEPIPIPDPAPVAAIPAPEVIPAIAAPAAEPDEPA
jgi:hypothetical protein